MLIGTASVKLSTHRASECVEDGSGSYASCFTDPATSGTLKWNVVEFLPFNTVAV